MERLTFEGNFCDIAQCDVIPGGSYCESGSCTQRKVWERLKAYEDTGLEPAMCANYKTFEDEAISKGVTFKRIVALMEADKDGRLVVLPCKVGDTAIDQTFADTPRLMKNTRLEIAYESRCGIIFHMGYDIFADLVEHGRIKPVSEEAEKALEAMKK